MSGIIRYAVIILLIFCSGWNPGFAQDPEMRHVFDIHANISAAKEGKRLPEGKQVIIPITGGEIKGEVEGRILPGGADYQIVDTLNKRTLLRAVYNILTPDSVVIKVINEGINTYGDGNYYFMTSPKFEVDRKSPYGWLNDRVFVCRPVGFGEGQIILRVWETR